MYNKILLLAFLSVLSLPSAAKGTFKLGVAYDLDGGITAQYKGYSFFVNSDAAAIDYRFQNFTNDNKTLNFYIDLGAFLENYDGNNADTDDSVGIRAPIGMTFGISNDFQAYIQAVPNYDFNNDSSFDVDGAIGIRYRF